MRKPLTLGSNRKPEYRKKLHFVRLQDLLDNRKEVALARAANLLELTPTDENGCMVTDTERRCKIRFNGRQVAAYRFVYCVLTGSVLTEDQVVRHRCHTRRCVNPEHLIEGTRADNKRDDYNHWANGTDCRHL